MKVQHDGCLFSLRSNHEEIVVFAALDLDFPRMPKRLDDLWNGAPMLDDENPVLAVLGAENADEPVSVLIGVDDRSEAQGVLREARPFRPFAGWLA